MLDINQYITPELIDLNLEGKTKEDIIKLLVNKIFTISPDSAGSVTPEDTYGAIIKREKAQSTGLGKKMAFPHARIEGWNRFIIVLGFHEKSIDFHSLDKIPANFICLMVSPSQKPYIILQAMSSILRIMSRKKDVYSFFKGRSPTDIVGEFKKNNIKVNRTVQAHDIMQPVGAIAKLDDKVEDIIQTMHLNHLDALPVIDEQNQLCGQISCVDIFNHELPDFFGKLHTVSFVKNMDPFQKYFNIKGDLKVSSFFNKTCSTISEDATLIEIVFQLTVKGNSHLFVVQNGELRGKIDRFSILNNILFF